MGGGWQQNGEHNKEDKKVEDKIKEEKRTTLV